MITDNNISLKVEHLSKTIKGNLILDNLCFQIDGNGVIGLLGPNGAGKSTLMKILVGLWNLSEGIVSYNILGENIVSINHTIPHTITRHIGYLPENNPLYEDMYVREYLRFMLSLSSRRRDLTSRVEELIELVGLSPMANKHIRELSKGYRQRVGLAQAIANDPKILILDEPTTGLDPNQLDDIRTLIRQLGQQRIVILSTHIMQEVKAMCSRAIILANGHICEDTTQLQELETLFRERTKNQPLV